MRGCRASVSENVPPPCTVNVVSPRYCETAKEGVDALAFVVIHQLFDPPFVPYRGVFSDSVDFWVLTTAVACVTLLTFSVTDAIWLYGGSEATIIETITRGRGTAGAVSRMPSHKADLDEGKIQLLTAYVWGLSNTKSVSQ